MSKFIKIFSIIFIIFSILISFYNVYASDINMNLTANETINEPIDTNQVIDETNENEQDTIDQAFSDLDDITNPSTIGVATEEGLSLSNILSILLITVGVIIILLAIAIIIRLK